MRRCIEFSYFYINWLFLLKRCLALFINVVLLALLSTYLHRVQRVLHSRAPLLDAGTEFPLDCLEFPLESRTPNERRQASASLPEPHSNVPLWMCTVLCALCRCRSWASSRCARASTWPRSARSCWCRRTQHSRSCVLARTAWRVGRCTRCSSWRSWRWRRSCSRASCCSPTWATSRPGPAASTRSGTRATPRSTYRSSRPSQRCASAPHDALSLYVLYLPMDEYLQNRKLSNMTNSGISVNTILGSIIIS